MTGEPPPRPPGSVDDRDDDLLDRLDAGREPASPEEAAAREPYLRLLERIRNLPPVEPDAGWQGRAEVRWQAARAAERRRRNRIGLAIAGALAAAAMIALWRRGGRDPEPDLQVAVLSADGAARGGDPAVDDLLRVVVRTRAAHAELRLYLDANLLARCPGATGCRVAPGTLQLDLRLAAPGAYRVIVLRAATVIPTPGDTGLDSDLLDARAAGATVERWPPIMIRS